MRSDWDAPRGSAAIRSVIARANAHINGDPPPAAVEVAERRWGRDSLATQFTRATVAGAGTLSGEWGSDMGAMRTEQSAFVGLLDSQSSFFRIPNMRVLPQAPVSFIAQTSTAAVGWRGEGKALRVSSANFDRNVLPPLTVGAIVVMSNELLREQTDEAEREIRRQLIDPVALAIDAQAFDVSESGSANVSPASIAYSGQAVASVGDFAQDFNAAAQELGGNLAKACVVMSPRTAAQVALTYAARGIVDGGPAGGSIMGLPLLTSQGLAIDSSGTADWLLVDGSAIVVRDDGAELAIAEQGSLEMTDSPTGDSLAPTDSSSTVISLFQTDNLGIKVIRRTNWLLTRSDAVITVTGASYGLGS